MSDKTHDRPVVRPLHRARPSLTRRVTALLALALALLTLVFPTRASAQDKTFYLDRLFVAGAPDDAIGLWRPEASRETRIFGQLGLGFALNPFRIENHIENGTNAAILDETSGAPVVAQLITYADVGVQLLERFAFQLELPVILAQGGNPTTSSDIGRNAVDLATVAAMDMRLDARAIVFRNDDRTFKLGANAAVWLPTGNEGSFGGDRSTSGGFGLSGEIDVTDFFVLLNTGVHFRPLATLNDFTLSNEWRFGVGVYVPMRDDALRLGGAIYGSTGIGNGTTFTGDNTPLEWMFEGRFALSDDKATYMSLGGGTRLSPGYAPDARVVAVFGTSIQLEDTEPTSPPRRIRIARATERSVDTDKDGIPDDIDLCPTDPEDHQPPNADDGCPAPPDRDGDGIVDSRDKCPDSPEDFDKIDDADGCPETDADNDTVLDAVDACPKEPGEPSAELDKNGCPQFIRRISGGEEIQILKQIQFETGKATILSNSFPILDEVVRLLTANPDINHLDIEGHTDDRGSADLNQKLSADRAGSVLRYIVEHGVDQSRLAAQGFGPSFPIADNNTAEGRQKNRRVEFHIRNQATGEEAPAPEPP